MVKLSYMQIDHVFTGLNLGYYNHNCWHTSFAGDLKRSRYSIVSWDVPIDKVVILDE